MAKVWTTSPPQALQAPTAGLAHDSWAYRGIFVASFAALLLVALVAQVLTWHWRSWLPGAEGDKGLIGGVKTAVYTFMSHLT